MTVVDASAVVEFLLQGEEGNPRAHLLAANDFQAPHLADIEGMHALRRRSLSFSAYDALHVALAEGLGCPLLTADGRLARAAEGLIPVERV